MLREKDVIAREYLLDYDSSRNLTTVKSGYFWSEEESLSVSLDAQVP